MSTRQRLLALVIAVGTALLCIGMAWAQDPREERGRPLYTCSVWNDRAWAGCP